MNIGKVLLIFFEGNEEKVIDSIISVLGVGREKFAFQQMYSNSEVNYKDIIFDFKRREVVKSNEEKKFTYTEFEILQLLAQNPGRVFSKEQIYDIVWNEPYSGDYDIYMKPCESYLLFYTVDEAVKTVTVLRVMQDGMDWQYIINRWLRENA